MKGRRWAFTVGEVVRPRNEWRGHVPSGVIQERQPWGDDGCYRVGKDRRFFAAYVFQLDRRRKRIK